MEKFNFFNHKNNNYAASLLLEDSKIIEAKFLYKDPEEGITKIEELKADRYRIVKTVEKNNKQVVVVLYHSIYWRRFVLSELEEKKLEKLIAANKLFRTISINAQI